MCNSWYSKLFIYYSNFHLFSKETYSPKTIYLLKNVGTQVNAGTCRTSVLIPFCHFNYKTLLNILSNLKRFYSVLNHTYHRKRYLNEVSSFARYLSNLLLYYMCQLPVWEEKMKYVVKGNCIIFWLCIIKGKSLWWNMLNIADPFEHMYAFKIKALDSTQWWLHF